MEPEMHTLSPHTRPGKRARSPEADTERPTKKRLSLQGPIPSPVGFGMPPVATHGHEDPWVAQTRNMSLTHLYSSGPTFDTGHLTPPSAHQDSDESMNMDTEEPAPEDRYMSEPPNMLTVNAHLPMIHVSGTPSPYPTPAPSPGPFTRPAAPNPTHHSLPLINTHNSFLLAQHSATQTPPLSTAEYSAHPIGMLQTPQGKRFSMGPRADCEKCRLGVKGHYAHFD